MTFVLCVWKYIAYEFCLPVKLIGLNGRRDSHEIETLFGSRAAAESSLHCVVDRRDGRWENMWNKLLFPWFIENHLQPKKHTFISVPPSNQMTTRLAGKPTEQLEYFTLLSIDSESHSVWKLRGKVSFWKRVKTTEKTRAAGENNAFVSYNYQVDGVSNHPSISEKSSRDCLIAVLPTTQ